MEEEKSEITKILDEAIDSKKNKRKAQIEDTLVIEEKIYELKKEMEKALKEDLDCIRKKKKAVSRLKLLPKVINIVENCNYKEIFLDMNLLKEIKTWLEPLEKGVFPCPEIRDTLLRLLFNLPIETDHFRESEIGKIVMFYSKTKTKQFFITRRIAKKLIQIWIRNIIS